MRKTAVIFFSVLLLSCARKPVYPVAHADSSGVRISLEELSDGRPVFHTFYNGSRGINYFVVRLGESVESYFDACGKCYPKRLGYRFEGGRLSCRTCDIKYPLDNLKDGIGSCYPIKLPGRIESGFYLIDKKEILAGAKYF